MMTPDQLRALADALEPMAAAPRFDDLPVVEFCAWARQCAEAEPVARICTDAEMRHRDVRWGRVQWIEAESELPEGALLYTHPAPAAPQAEPKREPLTDDWIIDTANEIHAALPFDADEQAELLWIVRAVERAHGIGGSDDQAEPQREPLSDDDINKLAWKQNLWTDGMIEFSFLAFAREVERAHGIGGSDEC